MLSAASAFAFGTLYVTDATSSPGTLDPFALGSLTAGTPTTVGTDPSSVAISPDGTTAYVANDGSGSVSVVDAATGAVTHTISSINAAGIAISPDGTRVLAVGGDSVTSISTATDTAGTPISLGGSNTAVAPAFLPNGQTAYVVNIGSSGSLSVIAGADTASPSLSTTIATGIPGDPMGLAVTPSGSKIFIVGATGAAAFVPGAGAATAITGLTGAYSAVAVSPDGTKAYFLNQTGSNGGDVQVLNIASGTVTALTTGNLGDDNLSTLVVSADGSTLYAALGDGGSTVELNAATGATIKTVDAATANYGAALTPDQAPVAALNATPATAGSASTLNAGGTVTADGGGATFAWNFGDGSSATTSTSNVTHVYAVAGTYNASVTVTDDQGCSTTLIYTGQTASCNGGSNATKTASVVVPPATVAKPPAPNTRLVSSRISSKKRSATFKFHATGSATSYQCALVREPSTAGKKHKKKAPTPAYHACKSPKSYEHLNAGSYKFYVRALGPGGTDRTPATKSFKIA